MTDQFVPNTRAIGETSPSLLERARRDDSDAWRMLVDLYAPLVYARCRQHWNLSPSETEHIGQEVFIAVARKLNEFERQRKGSFRTWLRTITDNKCKDHLARKQVAKAQGGSAARARLENVADTIDRSDSNSRLDERALILQQAIKSIDGEFSERDLKIFWNIAVNEKHRQDVAAEFEVTDNVVYLAYSRVKKRLREVYEELIDEDLMRD